MVQARAMAGPRGGGGEGLVVLVQRRAALCTPKPSPLNLILPPSTRQDPNKRAWLEEKWGTSGAVYVSGRTRAKGEVRGGQSTGGRGRALAG
jgi:hypothetical protein